MQQKTYTISDDYTVFESLFPIPEILRDELQSIQNKLFNEKNTSVLDKLARLQKKHPNNPHLLCDIATYYAVRQNNNKAIELYEKVIDKHEGYTFAYINMAQTFIDTDKFDEVFRILGENLQIEKLFPDRKEFYIEEIKAYLNVCIQFYLFQRNLEKASLTVDEFAAIDPYDERIEAYRQLLSFSKFAAEIEYGNESFDDAYDAEDIDTPELPKFQVPLIEDLFEFGGDIPMEFFNLVLKQDRQSLIVDLQLVLDYAHEHSAFFIDNIRHEERNTFVLHTFVLLGELKAKESLDK
jgi:tetratricopeptide (TPR) repeat protein